MIDLTKIDVLLGIGITVAFIAISGGVRGVYSVAALSRRERSNQATTPFPTALEPPSRRALPEKRRRAA